MRNRNNVNSSARPEWSETIFAEALARTDPHNRQRYLAEACAGKPELLTDIQGLIEAHESAGDFMERPRPAHGHDAPPASGQPVIPGFQIERTLGTGGLGAVYLAYDEKLQRQVAIKVLACLSNEALRSRLLEEARKAASLHDPAIVTIYAIDDRSPSPAIVMEVIEGFPVDRGAKGLSYSQKARILQELARAISVAHSHGLIHRDLKPENVMLTPDLRPKILDFGLAISVEEGNAPRDCFEGTPLYASPEQVNGWPLTVASDMFSFGSLMFKVLTGCAPFDGTTALEVMNAIGSSEPPFLKDISIGVPEDLQAVCLACLARNPEDRPSAEEVALDLGRYLVGEPVLQRGQR